MKTSLDDMAVFVDIIDYGGFKRAAQARGMALGTVSRKLALLEKKLGVTLISRTTRRIELTEYGAAYYEPCKRMLSYAKEAEQSIQEVHTQQAGLRKNLEKWSKLAASH